MFLLLKGRPILQHLRNVFQHVEITWRGSSHHRPGPSQTRRLRWKSMTCVSRCHRLGDAQPCVLHMVGIGRPGQMAIIGDWVCVARIPSKTQNQRLLWRSSHRSLSQRPPTTSSLPPRSARRSERTRWDAETCLPAQSWSVKRSPHVAGNREASGLDRDRETKTSCQLWN